MLDRTVLLLLLITLLMHGCAFHQVLGERMEKGMLVREEGSGVVVEHARKKMIELVSPLSVRVFEEVELREATKRFYQKVRVRSEAAPKEFPWWDVWTKLLLSTTVIPLFLSDYWTEGSYVGPNCRLKPEDCSIREVTNVLSRDAVVEDGERSTLQRRNVPHPDRVTLFINGLPKGDLEISSADVAIVDLHAFPELAALHKPLKFTFKYHDSYAYSLLTQAEVERFFEQSVPALPAGSR